MRGKRENGHVSFTERDGMRNKRVNQMRDEEESLGQKEMSMPIQDDV